jgi:hypothetical protein
MSHNSLFADFAVAQGKSILFDRHQQKAAGV